MHAYSSTDSGIPNPLKMTEFTVQSSFKLILPPHLIITASSVKLNEIIGQGNTHETCMTNACMSLLNLDVTSSCHVDCFRIGEFGIIYKAHIVKHKNGQVVTETMAVKTLKGEPDILKALIYRASCHALYTLYMHEQNLNM